MKTILKYLLIIIINFLFITILKEINHYDSACCFISYFIGGINLAIVLKD